MLNTDIYHQLHKGVVIPAHPLALTESHRLDEKRQRALTRYYLASGAGGVAVGVHTTQFEIRDPAFGLYEPVLKLASDEIKKNQNEAFIKVAGICGPTSQAVNEAKIAVKHGYHLGLVSMGGIDSYSDEDLIKRTQKIAEIIPVFGFYLQPAVGGRILPYQFWKQFVEIEGVCAIKVAAFNRYQTLDVVRAVIESDRNEEIALYTGNDDNIINDLLTPFRFQKKGEIIEKRFVGGLLGQWAVWTSKAVEMLNEIKKIDGDVPEKWLTRNAELTDANAAIFDVANNFEGCIPGIHEILRRQGLLEGRWCLNPSEKMSANQNLEIDRIYESYPFLNDDQFVKERLNDFQV